MWSGCARQVAQQVPNHAGLPSSGNQVTQKDIDDEIARLPVSLVCLRKCI